MSSDDKPLAWLHGEVKSPPFSKEARLLAGFLPRRLQRGESLSMPHSRPMPTIGTRCHELRVPDDETTWRIVYALEPDAVAILAVFAKKTSSTPKKVIETCQKRLKEYRDA